MTYVGQDPLLPHRTRKEREIEGGWVPNLQDHATQ